MYELGKIKKVLYNGRLVKMFDVWLVANGARQFFGCFQAKARVANRNLLASIEDRLD